MQVFFLYTERAIDCLIKEGVSAGLIITLNRKNATTGRLPALCDWIADLAQKGIRRVRLHILETDNEQRRTPAYPLRYRGMIESLASALAT